MSRSAKTPEAMVVRYERVGFLSHRDIAALLGISTAYVQYIEKRALAKMRAVAEADGYSFEELFSERTGLSGSKVQK
jgi:DNA-directed RNA polymerase specialized sigma24 family protein